MLETTDDYILRRDRYGRTAKMPLGKATIALPLDHPVSSMDDWRKIEHWYEYSEERFTRGWERTARQHRDNGKVVTVSIPGGFDQPRQLMGEEKLCLAYYEQPELIHAMLRKIGDMAFAVLDRVSATVSVDMLSVHEDMAGKSGPLAGPVQIREFVLLFYPACGRSPGPPVTTRTCARIC